MRQIGKNIWVVERDSKHFGLSMGVRSTIIRQGEHLWIHSPVHFGFEVESGIDKLGMVTDIVAPNVFHHLFAGLAQKRWSTARLWGPQALIDKRPDLKWDQELSTFSQSNWQETISCFSIQGIPRMEESVFFHKPSKSLIVTDFVFHFPHPQNLYESIFFFLLGRSRKNPCYQSRLLRWMTKDKQALKETTLQLLELDFEQVVTAHGEILHKDAKKALQRATQWMF